MTMTTKSMILKVEVKTYSTMEMKMINKTIDKTFTMKMKMIMTTKIMILKMDDNWSQDILQDEDEDDHDYQDNDDEGDDLYHQVYQDNDDEDNDTYHQNCQKDRQKSDQGGLYNQDDQKGSESYDLYDQQDSDQEGIETHNKDLQEHDRDSPTGVDNVVYISWTGDY